MATTRQTRRLPHKKATRKDGKASNEHYTFEQFHEALTKCSGKIALAARRLNCTRQTIYDAIARYPELGEIRKTEDESVLDLAELKLKQAILKGEAWAVCFALKTKGKHLGYIERSELTGGNGAPLVDLGAQIKAAATECRDLLTRCFERARAAKPSRKAH